MMKPKVKSGIVGSGFAASFHLSSLRRVANVDVEVVGVYSPTSKNRDLFAAKHGIHSYSAVEDLISDVDVVHVCTPAATHESIGIAALRQDRFVIIEKPFTGYFGSGRSDFDGDSFPRAEALDEATASISRLHQAERASEGQILYAENWVYAPAVQREREVIEKTGAQVLWIHGEEAHSGSHSKYYGMWSHSGGGSLMGKGVHPLTAALYLKRVEGRSMGNPIRPIRVSANLHAITRSPRYRDEGFIRTGYTDIEDFAHLHVIFEDDTFADIFASEIVMGGVHNWLEVAANNHRAIVNINPNDAFKTYNPREEQFSDIYVVEKTGTKQGWAFTSADEDWFTGYHHEMEAFYSNVVEGSVPESDSELAGDTISCVYAGYSSAELNGAIVDIPPVEYE